MARRRRWNKQKPTHIKVPTDKLGVMDKLIVNRADQGAKKDEFKQLSPNRRRTNKEANRRKRKAIEQVHSQARKSK